MKMKKNPKFNKIFALLTAIGLTTFLTANVYAYWTQQMKAELNLPMVYEVSVHVQYEESGAESPEEDSISGEDESVPDQTEEGSLAETSAMEKVKTETQSKNAETEPDISSTSSMQREEAETLGTSETVETIQVKEETAKAATAESVSETQATQELTSAVIQESAHD